MVLYIRVLGILGELGVALDFSIYDWESRDDELNLLDLNIIWMTLNSYFITL